MKKIVYFILFISFFLFSSNSYAISGIYNTESNIKKAILVEDYIIKHRGRIENFIIKYGIENNNVLINELKWLNESIEALQKIQNTSIEKEIAEDIMKAILIRIKKINENLKKQLKIEKDKFQKKLDKKKNIYSKLWIKLSDKINNINLKIAKKIYKNDSILSLKEWKIKKNLINLNIQSLKLRNFWSINFKSEKEIKETFINILKKIKIEVSEMKSILK